MKELRAFRRWLDEAQLVEGGEDDPRSGIELWFENLKHCGLWGVELQHAPSRASRRIVDTLGQLDDVEFVDLARYSHSPSMLGNRKGSYQSWRISFKRVVPRDGHRSYTPFDRQVDRYSTCDAERRAITHESNRRVECRLRYRSPHLIPVARPDMENTFPFSSMSFFSKDPLQLALLVPGVWDAGEEVSNFRRPVHGADARERGRTCVLLRSILRVSNHTKVSRPR